MIRPVRDSDFDAVHGVINDAAEAYRGVIAADCWREPYMSADELRAEIDAGVAFWAVEEAGAIAAVMGLQPVADVDLVRHAYTRTASQGRGFGGRLLDQMQRQVERPLLVGTWRAAIWAVRFYQRRGFQLIDGAPKDDLLHRYWRVPARQMAESVVLTDHRWRLRGAAADTGETR